MGISHYKTSYNCDHYTQDSHDMRILIAGAGAVGGYFGGRLIEAGADVTFMVRERRARQLQQHGLVIHSPHGDFTSHVPFIRWEDTCDPFDVLIVCCKAFDLVDTTNAIKSKIVPHATILPLLNGLAHLDYLDAQFSAATVLGGTCHISVTLDADGTVRHLRQLHSLTFGARTAKQQQACDALESLFMKALFNAKRSENIQQDMWEKWTFLTTLASITCLMRGSIGAITSTQYGIEITQSLLNEACAIATAAGFAPRATFLQESSALLLDSTSTLTASMLRDIEKGVATEADHIVGNLVRRGHHHGIATPLLDIAFTHLNIYEARRLTSTNTG